MSAGLWNYSSIIGIDGRPDQGSFKPEAVSHADARGLYQIWPSTGRLLARALDWQFDDGILLDPEKNTEMAAPYLDMLSPPTTILGSCWRRTTGVL